MLSNTLKLKFCYLNIIHILHPCYHPKIKGYIPKNHTHVKNVGTPQNFFLAFIDELEKPLFTKKTVGVDQKNMRIFTLQCCIFIKK